MSALDLTGLRHAKTPLVTRFAPSPTGFLHLGHVVNAIFVWGIASRVGAQVQLRLEDHDRIRCRPAYEHALLEDLDWLGFIPDSGRDPLARQQDRSARYEDALAHLRTVAHVYPCQCSRREIGGGPYPGTCRHRGLPDAGAPALRVELTPGVESFVDLALGPQAQDPSVQCGDLLLRDRDGHWTYQFAVTVDDLVDDVTLVIRGLDLLESTGRQIQLARRLGRNIPPRYLHHPLIMKAPAEKLSKSDGATGIRELRAAGVSAPEVIGRAAALVGLGLPGQRVEATDVGRFWDRI